MSEIPADPVAAEVAAKQEAIEQESEARTARDQEVYDRLSGSKEIESEPATEVEEASEPEAIPDEGESESTPVEEKLSVDPDELAGAVKQLAFAKVNPEDLGLSPEQTIAFGEAIRVQRSERDRLLHEMSQLRKQDADTEPSAELDSEPGRPPESQLPSPPPAELASVLDSLAEPLGLDADGAKHVGDALAQLVQAQTAHLAHQNAQMAQAVEAMLGRTLQAEIGERFPELRGKADEAQRLYGLAASMQDQFDGDFEAALEFAAKGLGVASKAEPKAERKSRPRKTTSTRTPGKGSTTERPTTKEERDYAEYLRITGNNT